jgi:hypothetical protein
MYRRAGRKYSGSLDLDRGWRANRILKRNIKRLAEMLIFMFKQGNFPCFLIICMEELGVNIPES